MPTTRQPRAGSMQFWPRKRARRPYPRIRARINGNGLEGFAGYKVGMTHVVAFVNDKNSHLKGEKISVPVTIVECPPMKIASVRFYKKTTDGLKVKKEIFVGSDIKELKRKLPLKGKKNSLDINNVNYKEYDDLRITVYTQPKLTGIGKKKPEIFELSVRGALEEKYNFIRENIDKEITLDTVFNEGDLVDIKSITKGKGFQGPVKRFGISIRQHKSEKAIRNPGSLGPWNAQGHIMWRVAHAGKMGYHQRTEYNKLILKIISKPDEITPKGGFLNYGLVKNPCVLIKGSVPGPKKRLILMHKPVRKYEEQELPTIIKISTEEKQGN